MIFGFLFWGGFGGVGGPDVLVFNNKIDGKAAANIITTFAATDIQ